MCVHTTHTILPRKQLIMSRGQLSHQREGGFYFVRPHCFLSLPTSSRYRGSSPVLAKRGEYVTIEANLCGYTQSQDVMVTGPSSFSFVCIPWCAYGKGGLTRKHYISVKETAVMKHPVESALKHDPKECREMSPMRHHDSPKAIVLRRVWPATFDLPNL